MHVIALFMHKQYSLQLLGKAHYCFQNSMNLPLVCGLVCIVIPLCLGADGKKEKTDSVVKREVVAK